MALVFGVESSCDETSVALVENGNVLCNVVASQTIHQNFGGVVPELAARDHLTNILPVAELALAQSQRRLEEVDAFAVTQSPGLIGCLMVGSQFTKSLALTAGKPFYAINHLKAHVISPCISHPTLTPPYLCLLASGGHTQIIHCVSWTEMKLLGGTLDDAAGEAFDKSARLLGFTQFGGKAIDEHAQRGDMSRFPLPHPRMNGYNYSFSGLKTAIRYLIERETSRDEHFVEKAKCDLAASVQYAIVETLIAPLMQASQELGVRTICIAGGVSANSYFRTRMSAESQKRGFHFFSPSMQYCTDNAAMIAFLAEKYISQGKPSTPLGSACIARATYDDLG